MGRFGILCSVLIVILINVAHSQVPPRLNIPGAVLVGGPPKGAHPVLRQRLQQLEPLPRLRSRVPNALPPPIREVRPVVEEPEEEPQHSAFDDEVNKLGLSTLQQVEDEPVERQQQQQPVAFRPERPVPVLRQDLRENVRPAPIQAKSYPIRQDNQRPVIRQELKQEVAFNRPAPQRQEYDAPVQHVRRPAQQPVRQQPQPVRQAPQRIASRPTSQYLDDEPTRARKPTVQILRKYRTDNADGSITWGYENDDGSFKEENIGNDCITRGKYGYVDPEGTRREYSYETGGKCEDPDPEELAAQLPQQQLKGGKKPYRLPAQY